MFRFLAILSLILINFTVDAQHKVDISASITITCFLNVHWQYDVVIHDLITNDIYHRSQVVNLGGKRKTYNANFAAPSKAALKIKIRHTCTKDHSHYTDDYPLPTVPFDRRVFQFVKEFRIGVV
ncbi:unnamed protein product [Caenorhabditis angaria]|uniref:Uncharacterized protein n=1 Tax=Caenorhabditis angaria TaxID=860376 RepID=A0A9P1ISU8_9PELO|nr:unnamed protein product [Caenorhabditis angaria]